MLYISWVASAYIAGLYFFMSGVIGWSWTYFYIRDKVSPGTFSEPVGITLVVLCMGMLVTGVSVRVLYDNFFHINQLPLGPCRVGSKANQLFSEAELTEATLLNDLPPAMRERELQKLRRMQGEHNDVEICCWCDKDMPRATAFCVECGMQCTFKRGMATLGFSAKEGRKSGSQPSFFEVVSGAVRHRKVESGVVMEKVTLPVMAKEDAKGSNATGNAKSKQGSKGSMKKATKSIETNEEENIEIEVYRANEPRHKSSNISPLLSFATSSVPTGASKHGCTGIDILYVRVYNVHVQHIESQFIHIKLIRFLLL